MGLKYAKFLSLLSVLLGVLGESKIMRVGGDVKLLFWALLFVPLLLVALSTLNSALKLLSRTPFPTQECFPSTPTSKWSSTTTRSPQVPPRPPARANCCCGDGIKEIMTTITNFIEGNFIANPQPSVDSPLWVLDAPLPHPAHQLMATTLVARCLADCK